MISAVVLSSHVISLGIICALGRMNVPVIAIYYDKRDMGQVSKYVKEIIFAPHPEENEEQFIDLLLQFAQRYERCLLIPADEATVKTVSKHKDQLESILLSLISKLTYLQFLIGMTLNQSLKELSICLNWHVSFYILNTGELRGTERHGMH